MELNPNPELVSVKINFDWFQCWEKLSADVETPWSPKPEALASDEISRKGTAVVITLLSFWEFIFSENKSDIINTSIKSFI